VGLPLAIAFADRGLNVGIYDLNEAALKLVESGQLPFQEDGAAEVLDRVLSKRLLSVSSDPALIAGADAVVVVIGTPVDEHLNPDPHAVTRALKDATHHFRDGQLLVLRSTVYPGVTDGVERMFAEKGISLDVAFCPERIAEGKAMEELFTLPQIVSGHTQEVRDRAARLFGHLTESIVELEPEEAELAKLFTNTWRYIKFAAANQFYVMANDHGLDFDKIRKALAYDYPRAADMPGAGFAAGPCLFKDTMQLSAFTADHFPLGQAAMQVNEGLPAFIVSALERRYGGLHGKTVGILGMAFKSESDDPRASLSYKLRKLLSWAGARVLATDPYVVDDRFVTQECVIEESDILILGAPHKAYRGLQLGGKDVVDVWGAMGAGIRL
jgi:UDP-N-acetyl-D-mannosaminuronic acid dehydrogenase